MKKIIRVEKKDNIFQYVETLKRNRTKRFSNNEFVVEGVCNINNAIKNNWKVKHFIYGDYSKLSSWAKEKLKNSKTENWQFDDDLMKAISDKSETSELLAIFEMKNTTINNSKNPLIIIFDTPSKKGNLGTIIRSAEALACNGIIITGHSVDLYDPVVISSSMGSFFNIPIIKLNKNEEIVNFINKLRAEHKNLQVVATTLNAEQRINENDFTKPTILLIGNEAKGLNKFYIDNCDKKVKIEMVNNVESLNVSCATSIILYEIYKQRYIK